MANKIFSLLVIALASTGVLAQSPQGQAGPEATVVLKYRDPSTPLTIGEMSALQAQKAEADFFKKFGYTVTAPPPPGPTPQEQERRAASVRPSGSLSALGVYGPLKSPMADITVNGVLLSVRGGERLAGGLYVQSIQADGLTVQLPSKRRGVNLTYTIRVGDVLEYPL